MCKHRHRDRPHPPSARWTSFVRVDEDPRAPSDWQLRNWRACAFWQSRPLPRCLYWTQRPKRARSHLHKQRTEQDHPRHHRHYQGLRLQYCRDRLSTRHDQKARWRSRFQGQEFKRPSMQVAHHIYSERCVDAQLVDVQVFPMQFVPSGWRRAHAKTKLQELSGLFGIPFKLQWSPPSATTLLERQRAAMLSEQTPSAHRMHNQKPVQYSEPLFVS